MQDMPGASEATTPRKGGPIYLFSVQTGSEEGETQSSPEQGISYKDTNGKEIKSYYEKGQEVQTQVPIQHKVPSYKTRKKERRAKNLLNESYLRALRLRKAKRRVWKRENYICFYCGLDMREDYKRWRAYPTGEAKVRARSQVLLSVDHRVPVAQGGPDDDYNLVTACLPCNYAKGAKGYRFPRLMLLFLRAKHFIQTRHI